MNDWCKKGGSRGYIMTIDRKWDIGKKGSGHTKTIPKGFEFESSVPKWLHWFFSPDDPYFLWAAAVHDLFLQDGYRPAFAAGEWHDAARSMHAPKFRRIAAFVAVSLWTILGGKYNPE